MLGPPKPRRLDEPIAVSLEDLVPADNCYRHLEAKLDLGFVREWVRELYANRGRPSIDPVVFFKLQLVMFFGAIRTEPTTLSLFDTISCNSSRMTDRGRRAGYPLCECSNWRTQAYLRQVGANGSSWFLPLWCLPRW